MEDVNEVLSWVGAISGLIGMIAGLIGAITGITGIVNTRFTAVHNFFSVVESPDFIDARDYVYKNDIEVDNPTATKMAAFVINFFHHWGFLAKKGFLPMWVFDSASGAGAIRLYKRLENYIWKRRKENKDPTYAEYFEWLCLKIKKRRKWHNLRKSQV